MSIKKNVAHYKLFQCPFGILERIRYELNQFSILICHHKNCNIYKNIALSCENGSYSPHPTDCTKYLMCSNGQEIVGSCNTGLHWSPKGKYCDYPATAGCTSEGGGQTTTTTTTTTQTSTTPTSGTSTSSSGGGGRTQI